MAKELYRPPPDLADAASTSSDRKSPRPRFGAPRNSGSRLARSTHPKQTSNPISDHASAARSVNPTSSSTSAIYPRRFRSIPRARSAARESRRAQSRNAASSRLCASSVKCFDQLRPTRRRAALVRHSRRQPRSLVLVPLLQHRPRQLIAIAKMPVEAPLAHMQIPRQHLNAHRINPILRQPRKRRPYPVSRVAAAQPSVPVSVQVTPSVRLALCNAGISPARLTLPFGSCSSPRPDDIALLSRRQASARTKCTSQLFLTRYVVLRIFNSSILRHHSSFFMRRQKQPFRASERSNGIYIFMYI